MLRSCELTCHCVCTPEHPLLWSLAQIPFLSSRSCTPMAMSLLVLLTAGDLLPTLAQVVPLPSFLLLLGIARLWSLPEQIALLRRHNSLYNFVMDCVYPALLQGISTAQALGAPQAASFAPTRPPRHCLPL